MSSVVGLVAGEPALRFASDGANDALAWPDFTPVGWLRFQLDNQLRSLMAVRAFSLSGGRC